MALRGTLRDFSLADIFQLIGIQKKTGVLTLKSDKETCTVAFVEGQVVGTESTTRRLEDRLGSVLVKSGRITDPDNRAPFPQGSADCRASAKNSRRRRARNPCQ